MTGIIALYIFMLAAFTGYEVIARVPVILHTPLMSGSNFVHASCWSARWLLWARHTRRWKKSSALSACSWHRANAVGGYVVTERMLEMFKASGARAKKDAKEAP